MVFITGHGDVPMAVSALKQGAVDFVEKPFGEREMLRVVEQCLRLERETRDRRLQEADTARRLGQLTQREREVLELIIVGKLNKQIADVLGISIKTVEVHRARVMEKMARIRWPSSSSTWSRTLEPGASMRADPARATGDPRRGVRRNFLPPGAPPQGRAVLRPPPVLPNVPPNRLDPTAE